MSDQQTHPPIGKVFWALLLTIFGALLVGLAPDATLNFREARMELEELQKVDRNVGDAYTYVAPAVEKAIGANIPRIVREKIQRSGKQIASEEVINEMNYFFVDVGSLSIPSKVGDAFMLLQRNIMYSVKTPRIDLLEDSLEELLAGNDSGFVNSVSISCNYAVNRCQVRIGLSTTQLGKGSISKERMIPAKNHVLPQTTLYDRLAAQSGFFSYNNATLPNTAKVLPQIYDEEIAKAIILLRAKETAQFGELSLFGLTVRGKSALVMLPTVLVAISFLLWVCVKEVRRSGVLDPHLACPLFYKDYFGSCMALAAVTALPTICSFFIQLRFFVVSDMSSWVGVALTLTLSVIAWRLALEIAKVRSGAIGA